MTNSTPEAIAVYAQYPRRVAKPPALRAIMRAIDKDGFDRVMERTKEYAIRAKSKELRFIPYPATFYNQEIYNDDYDAIFPNESDQRNHQNGHRPITGAERRQVGIPVQQRTFSISELLERRERKSAQ